MEGCWFVTELHLLPPASRCLVQIAITGGGAAGFFASIACARANPANEISIFERGSEFLSKVRISGGGRCNVTHACFDPRILSEHYPRGEQALISPLHRFSPDDTVAWFEAHGVRLKTESDGRMFPVTDSSQTIIDCLLDEARAAGIRLFARTGIEQVRIGQAACRIHVDDDASRVSAVHPHDGSPDTYGGSNPLVLLERGARI